MKEIIVAIILAGALIGGAIIITRGNTSTSVFDDAPTVMVNNVTIVDGKQIIEIKARGGYQPRKSVARAGIPTIIRFNTSGTFDCSSSVRIPSLNISKSLPQTGSTDVDVGTHIASTLKGSCGMGMYPFEVEFRG